ncbi:MAG: type I-E CRISPR-associated protein Cas5/CasD [Verrucomicrobiae bacterium]|nr:type I-E CRISPR-associated protein Cas5/CasD [Verrucomicrobiae bacterium]MDW7979950.1 type I-E CRISPR-associated protein Cas5/CasD [Verrucomicrobiales bacterium]
MSTDTAYLALMLDAPMQSWGFASRFQRRTTAPDPTKSGVIGMICAAMGIGKGTHAEREILPQLAALKMTSIFIPRAHNPVRRLIDFHTVQRTRRASGKLNEDTVVTHREYLLDARFGVILAGPITLLEQVAHALQNPVWGIWLGRKSCIPAEPVFRGLFTSRQQAEQCLLGNEPITHFSRVEEVSDFSAGADSYNDQPISFGQANSSSEGRLFSIRRIKRIHALIKSS